MTRRIREHIRSNVVGYMALFVALSGTAYAVDGPLPGQNQVGSEDIINNEVRSADLINGDGVRSVDVRDDTLAAGGLGAVDLAPDSVGNSEVADESLSALDLAPDSVGSSEIAPNSIGTVEVATGSLTSDDIVESTLITMADTGNESCNPTSTAFVNCGDVGLVLPAQSDVLVMASGAFVAGGVGPETKEGSCVLQRSPGTPSLDFRDDITLGAIYANIGDGFARNAVDLNVPAGITRWTLACNETDPEFRVRDVQLTVMRLVN